MFLNSKFPNNIILIYLFLYIIVILTKNIGSDQEQRWRVNFWDQTKNSINYCSKIRGAKKASYPLWASR